MATWKIMLSLQALTTTISLVAIIIYMIIPVREN